MRKLRLAALTIMGVMTAARAGARDRLKTLPGYERYQQMLSQIQGAVGGGGGGGFGGRGFGSGVVWSDDGKAVDFTKDGKRMRYDIAGRRVSEAPPTTAAPAGGGRGRGGGGAP